MEAPSSMKKLLIFLDYKKARTLIYPELGPTRGSQDLLLLRTRERTPEADEKIPGGMIRYPGIFCCRYVVENSSLSQTKASSS